MTDGPETQKKRGRKAIHASPAARAAAYRARKAEAIAEALAKVAVPDTREIEAVKKELQVARDRNLDLSTESVKQELQIMNLREQIARQSVVKPGRIKRSSESNRYDALRKYFVTGYYPRPDDAKRLRVNTKKAAGAASEVLATLKTMDLDIRNSVAADIEALEAAAALLRDYGKTLEEAQESAESMKLKRIRDQEKAHAVQVKTTIEEMFPNLEKRNQEALQMAQDLLIFEKEGEAWLVAKYRVDGANAYLDNSSDIKNAVTKNNLARIVQLVAEVKIGMPKTGRRYPYNEEIHWAPGWADFEEWRKTRG